MVRIPLPFLVALCALAACSSSTEPSTPPATLMPLAVGNYWVDRMQFFDTNGVLQRTAMDSMPISGVDTIDGQVWYRTYNGVRVANRSDGFWVRLGPGEQWLAGLHPASVGDTFGIRLVSFDTTRAYRIVARVAATDRRITTPAGTFTCYEYRHGLTRLDGTPIPPEAGFYDERYYAAPGIGWVRSETYTLRWDGSVVRRYLRELIRYRVN